MIKKQLRIKLLPDGSIEMETVGIKGEKCKEYVKLLEELTDAKIIEQDYTQEYWENEENIDFQSEFNRQ